MDCQFVIGMDIPKHSFDLAILPADSPKDIFHNAFNSDAKGFNEMMKFIKETIPDFDIARTLFCMEATGLYCNTLLQFFESQQANVWVENALQIKRSMGIKRGKTDKVDSINIAKYAFKNAELVRLWKPTGAVLEKIKHLATLRERIVVTQKRLLTPIEELKDTGQVKMADLLYKLIKKSINAIDADLKNIEAKIMECLKEDASLNHLFSLLTSVVGIGFVTAINLIIHTQGFNVMFDSRKLACYCGAAPFPFQSGISIKGRTKISHMANKKLKTNLHLAALTAIRYDLEIKAYYDRKVLEGKPKMSVINAVRFKLLARVVSVVKNDREYVRKTA
ncbi:MAG: IS110 family transposase [Bacteroidetes bacterium]|nr:IS110 family transposase [Bacteroidota bacterium]MBS1930072.1 IS110 family transposase [Bacteroidota bacterium]